MAARPRAFARSRRVLNVAGGVLLAMLAGFAALFAYDTTQPAVSVLMVGRWIGGKPVVRQWVPLSSISPRLIDAVIISEDGQFCMHDGVDWHQMQEVLDDPDGPSRGASTITMQVARNLFLWNGRSFVRKALEVPLALALDALWSKRRILEVYLNIAEWGEDGVFGAEAAARHDFRKPASALTARESALMATALPNPLRRHPEKPSRGHRELAAINLERVASAAEWTQCVR